MQNLEGAIAKYGGEDEAYKMKLKNSIRDSLGYSNYVSQRDKALKKPIDVSLMKGNITPAGVKQLVGGAMDTKNQEVDAYNTMAGKTDVAAGQIAADRIAKEKAAKAAAVARYGINNGVMFQPTSQLETKMADYMKNPYNPDGSVKTIDQFKQEMSDYFTPRENVDMTYQNAQGGSEVRDNPTAQNIQEVIDKRVPKDFVGNEQTYAAMAQGFSRKQATDPSTSGAVRDAMQTEIDPATQEEVPKYSFSDIQNRYPDLADTEIKQIMKPVETKEVVKKLATNNFINNRDELTKLYTDGLTNASGEVVSKGWSAVMASPDFKALDDQLTMEHPDLTALERNTIIYNYVRSIL